jgi:hypothetical protein
MKRIEMAEKASVAGGGLRNDGVLRLIGRYKDLISEKAEETARRSDALKANLAIFWPGSENVRTTQAERQRNEAPSFNIVRLFQIGGLEKYHSRFLADLLDPRGCLGQRTLFLERFLEILGLGLLSSSTLQLHMCIPTVSAKRRWPPKLGMKANGGGFNNALGRLRTLELVQGRGELRASDNLFDSSGNGIFMDVE